MAIALSMLHIVCEGFCTEVHHYHAKCVGLSELEHHACDHNNIRWMCDPCCELMSNSKFRNTVNGLKTAEHKAETGVADLRTEVSKLYEIVNHLESALQRTVTEAPSQETSIGDADDRKLLSSTVVQQDEKSSEVKPRLRINSQDERKLALHLSNIANDVTEQEVAEMVTDVFGIKRVPAVQLLVPSWKDKSSLAFISFKVEIDPSLRTKALTSSIWPAGIRCREFRDYSKDVWRPINRSC